MGLFYDAYSYGVLFPEAYGLFPEAYDLFCIPLILILNGRVYYEKVAELNKHVIPPVVVFTMVVIAFVGTAIGQRVTGWLGDLIGRCRVYRFRLIIMVLSSIACGFSKCSLRNSLLVSLGLYRFVLGVGIGVDYPFSANESGTYIAALFSKQFLEILGVLAVLMEVCAMFDRAFDRVDPTPKETDIAWTWTVMLSAIPAALTFYKTPGAARYINKFYTNCIFVQCTGKQLKIRSKEYIFRY